MSGRGRVHSYTVDRVGLDPAQRERLPLVVAIVELEEGPRLLSSVVGCPQTPEDLVIDMALTATFVPFDGTTVLCFEPAGAAA